MRDATAPTPTRRRALTLGAAAAAAPLTAIAGEPAPRASLDAAARGRGLRFGSAIAANAGGGIDNPAYAHVVAAECGVVVPENEMKWRALQPAPGAYDFGPADRIVAWAKARGVAVRGHNLLWHNTKWLPDWVNAYDFGSRPASAAEKLLRTHVTTVCRRFGDLPTSWDVVNEAVDPATGGLRDTVFSRALGDRVVDVAFQAAREALPSTKLVYNDYMSWGGGDARHRAGVLRLLERLKRDGVPVDALGLQSHIGGEGDPSAAAARRNAWRGFLGDVTGLGLGLLVSELDVNDADPREAPAAKDAAVAGLTRDYLDLTLSFPQVGDVLCWGMVDRFSWLRKQAPPAGGPAERPSPYDDAYRPKPMREAIAAALRAAPARSAV